jgi:hypothetical protein
VMEGSDTVFIGVLVFVSGVTVNGVLLIDIVIVGGVKLSLDVESEREIVSSKVEVLSVSVTTVSGLSGGSSFSPTLADVR